MNKVAFLTTEFAIKALYDISRARVNLHLEEKLPDTSVIFAVNHFTRIETVFLPFHIQKITGMPVWSLASSELFQGFVGDFISQAGALSTKDPDRDKLMVKSLLTGEANWIIFPEGLMLKNKKAYENGRLLLNTDTGKRAPHTGAATLALRSEFYRERLRYLKDNDTEEFNRLIELFEIEETDEIFNKAVSIVPVNITYYPMMARENLLSRLAGSFIENPSKRMLEELQTEGTMLLAGVDVDIRFGSPIKIRPYLTDPVVEWDICSKDPISFNDDISSKEFLQGASIEIMHRYMHSIYSMTTLNHDHLFASILYRNSAGKMSEEDLRKRVFLAATMDTGEERYYKHQSMKNSQIHLLTDDRYDKYQNFIDFAVQKDLITLEEDGTLVKNPQAFNEDAEFHTTRIENPLIVMANEVEPLTKLQYNLKLLAGETTENISEAIAAQILETADRRYRADYTLHYIEEETKGIEIGCPYLLEPETPVGDIGVLMIHGYMSAPAEVRGLADYLVAKGYYVYAPRLMGHGTSPEDLAERSYLDWVDSVEEGFVMLRHRFKKVVVGGFSTGAGLALNIASRLDGLSGVFAVAPPMQLKDYSAKFIPAVSVWNQMMSRLRLDNIKKKFVENNPENPHINYLRNPIAGIRELAKLMDDLEGRLKDIKVPAYVLQSRNDPVVNVKGTRKVFEKIGSENKEYHLFNTNRHGILLREGAERVYRTIGDFVEDVTSDSVFALTYDPPGEGDE